MTEFAINRRDLLKGAGVGALSLAGLSAGSVPAAAHEKIDRPATDLLGPIQVPANSDAGFNYPYYLYVPETAQEVPVPMLVEPNNSGFRSDDLDEHRSHVEERLADGLGPQLYSKALVVPLLVPVFPRPNGEIAPNGTYTHALDEDTMELDGTPLERVDLHLRRMIEHAQGLLRDASYPVADDVLMNGFSASGNFVNRFAALHPEKVRSLTAGGINGTPILPLERAKGHELDYPIGIADLEVLTGEPFDAERWREVSQFLYLGGEDENDTVPYGDAWSERHQRVALDVYGEDMQEDRMPYSESVYAEAGADATFKVYDGVGHSAAPLEIQQDIANFHRRKAGLKQVAFAERPQIGATTVEFDTFVFGDREYELRVRSAARGDITESPASVTTGEEGTAAVTLGSAVAEEEITGLLVPAGATAPDTAVASVTTEAKSLPLVGVVDAPTVSRPSITVEYGVSGSYQTNSRLHLFIENGADGRSLLTTFEPGTVETAKFDLTAEAVDVTVEDGSELSVFLVDVDDGSRLASTSFVVGAGDGGGAAAPGVETVTFATQPTDARDRLDVAYSVADDYEPESVLTLRADLGADTTVLLGVLEPGDEGEETFSVEQVPMDAGTDVAVRAVDERPLAADRTVVFHDTGGAVTVEFTEPPTADDPSATVRYSVSESYEVTDSLTLRVYDGTLYGSDPGDAFALLSPGDEGAASFTIGDDTDGDVEDPVVAVVDEVPLARADPEDAVEQGDETDGQSGESEQTTRTEQPEESTEQSDAATEESADEGTAEPTAADGPGFGAGGALASLGGLGYVLNRRLDDAPSGRSLEDDAE